jgi:hypothetical protein
MINPAIHSDLRDFAIALEVLTASTIFESQVVVPTDSSPGEAFAAWYLFDGIVSTDGFPDLVDEIRRKLRPSDSRGR